MLLAVSPAMTVTVSAGSTTGKSSKGWVITSDGQRKYRKNGKFVKGCQKIGKNYYFFNVNYYSKFSKNVKRLFIY